MHEKLAYVEGFDDGRTCAAMKLDAIMIELVALKKLLEEDSKEVLTVVARIEKQIVKWRPESIIVPW